MKEDYQKIFSNLTWFFPLHPVPFYGQDYEKQEGLWTSYHCLFGLKIMFRKIPVSVMYNLGNFDDLIQTSFWVIPKVTFANLCKPIHDVIIIPVSSDPWIWKLDGKEKNLQKVEYLENEKGILDEIKSIFCNFWNALF